MKRRMITSWAGLTFLSAMALSAQTVPVDSVRAWMFGLAGDAMRGRANGSAEMRQAAEYIALRFRNAGLVAVPGTDGFYQPFSFSLRRGDPEIHEQNVIGYLEGADPILKKECVIVSAHYDHIGVGTPVAGDSIYNGADDNASGVCAVLGAAQLLAESPERPARSILFVAWAGEEMGLQGSRHYVQHPLWPLDKTVLGINFEMLGRPEKIGRQRYYLTGAPFSSLVDIIRTYNENGSWQMDNTVAPVDMLMFASDNAAFAAVHRKPNRQCWGIVSQTLAMEAGGDHYHRPHDGPEAIDIQNLADFIPYVSGLIRHLADRSELPAWTDDHFHPLAEYEEE